MTRFRASSGLAACRRNVDAIAVSPLDLSSQRPVFRSAARTCGAAPVRTRQASSPRLTSRTQCNRFSMSQCPRAIASSRWAEASSGPRLVMAQTVSSVRLPRIRRTRSSRQTCLAPGQSRYPCSRVVVVSRRISSRPCPLSRVWAWSSSTARRLCSRGEKAGV